MIRQRVNEARSIQLKRSEKRGIHSNAQMGTKDIKRYCGVKEGAEKLLALHLFYQRIYEALIIEFFQPMQIPQGQGV